LNPPAPPTCPASTNRVRLPFSRDAAPTDKDAHAIARFRVPPSRPRQGVRSQSVLCPTPCARTDRGCRGRCPKEGSGCVAVFQAPTQVGVLCQLPLFSEGDGTSCFGWAFGGAVGFCRLRVVCAYGFWCTDRLGLGGVVLSTLWTGRTHRAGWTSRAR